VVKALCLGHLQRNLNSRSGKPRRFESCGSHNFLVAYGIEHQQNNADGEFAEIPPFTKNGEIRNRR
jgi:hypothetical protein